MELDDLNSCLNSCLLSHALKVVIFLKIHNIHS